MHQVLVSDVVAKIVIGAVFIFRNRGISNTHEASYEAEYENHVNLSEAVTNPAVQIHPVICLANDVQISSWMAG